MIDMAYPAPCNNPVIPVTAVMEQTGRTRKKNPESTRSLHSSGEADDPLQPDDSLEASAGLGMSVQILVIDRDRKFNPAALHCQNMDPVKCIGIADLSAGEDFPMM